MKVLIDACVLFPTVLREIVLGTAETGAFEPLWSERILEEWRRAAARLGPSDGAVAETEIAAARDAFPSAVVPVSPDTLERITLKDRDDEHVLAAAIDGGAAELLTLNVKDFPTNVLAGESILRRHPDEFLLEAFHADPEGMRSTVDTVLTRAAAHGIDTSNRRSILKRARLPRLAKALDQV